MEKPFVSRADLGVKQGKSHTLWEFHLLIIFFSLFVSVSPDRRYNVEQVMAGTMFHLTIEAKDSDHPNLFKAKVWVKPLENFKHSEEFKPVEKPFVSRADLSVTR